MADLLRVILAATPGADIFFLILVVAGLCWIIWLQYQQRGAVAQVSDNHLSGLPEMEDNIKKLVILSEQQSAMLGQINTNLVYLRGRLNGSAE